MSSVYISPAARRRVAAWAKWRCCYYQTQTAVVGDALEIDHIIPVAAGGASEEDNLCLACSDCNEAKGAKVTAVDPQTGIDTPLYNPRQQAWAEHFSWDEDNCVIIGLTAPGRATVAALQLNRSLIVKARKRWVMVGWHPPSS